MRIGFWTAPAFVATLLVSSLAFAQPEPCLPLTPTGTQGGALLPGAMMNVRYGGSDREPLALDVYPHGGEATRPLAVVLRGGTGTVGQRSSYVGQLVELLGDSGYVVATVDYRSSIATTSDADLTRALRMLTMCHPSALRVDPYKLVLVAEDSAAPMALRVAARLRELRVGRYAGAPPAPAAVVIAGGRLPNRPVVAVPTIVIHGGADADVPVGDARALCASTAARCQVIEVPGASHRTENWWPSQWSYKADLIRALEPIIGSAAPAAVRPPVLGSGLRKRIVYDPTTALTLDAWVPAGTAPHAAVVLVHGGGWEAGDRVTYIAPMFALAASKGLAWISIDYRLTPGVTVGDQVADVARALAWLREHSGELRIDPARLVLVGESASGHLVAQVAASEPTLAGVVSFYGVYDLEAMAGDPADPRSLARRLLGITVLDDAARARLREFSPVHHASSRLPPMLLVAGAADRLIAQQRAYATALRAAGAQVEVIEIEGAPHGMEAWNDRPTWKTWEPRVMAWIAARR